MFLIVHAKPKAKRERVVKLDDAVFEVAVREAPRDGKANKRIQELLAAYLQVPVGRLRLIKGATTRRKIFELQD